MGRKMENEMMTGRAAESSSAVATDEEPNGSRVEKTPGEAAESIRIEGIVIGRLVRGGPSAEVLVDYPENPSGGPSSALSTAKTGTDDVGREVALAFQGGDPRKPVMLGFLEHPREMEIELGGEEDGTPDSAPAGGTADGREGDEESREGGGSGEHLVAQVDDERLVLSAEKEIVLRCGRSSITLTRAGKILIRGRYLLSRSSGVNRIKGGSVQIN